VFDNGESVLARPESAPAIVPPVYNGFAGQQSVLLANTGVTAMRAMVFFWDFCLSGLPFRRVGQQCGK
jgi:hypothetical protein